MTGRRIARKLPAKRGSKQLPEGWEETLRGYKKAKRREALAAERALDRLFSGSAYMPRAEGFSLLDLTNELRRARREWSKWWRNA
jgi:hypothetical protein